MSKIELKLQRFAEGAAAGGEGGTVEGTVDDAQEGGATKVVYGKEVTDDISDEGITDEPEENEPTFDELIEGKFKDDFSKRCRK